MQSIEMIQLRLKDAVEHHDRYDFTVFIELLRKIMGLNRKKVCEDLNMSQTYLFNVERGYFQMAPPMVDLVLLGEYYGVDPQLLKDKLNYFIMQGKNNPRSTTKKEGVAI
jgi:transcriptional regulator with XRE-family HTH domain